MPNMDLESMARCALALNWIPGFALCLAQGIVTGIAVPVVGIIPLTGSLVMSCLHFYARRPSRLRLGHHHTMDGTVGDTNRKLTKLWNHGVLPFLLDMATFIGFFIVLVITWCLLDSFYMDRDVALIIYATFPLIISWLAHLVLALARLGDLSRALRQALVRYLSTDNCPNCPPRYHTVPREPSPAMQEDEETGVMPAAHTVQDGMLHGNLYDADSPIVAGSERGSDNGSKGS